MGGSSSTPLPAPVIVQGPTEAEIQSQKDAEAADALRGRKSTRASAKSKNNVSSQSRATGFSGSGIFIPGRN